MIFLLIALVAKGLVALGYSVVFWNFVAVWGLVWGVFDLISGFRVTGLLITGTLWMVFFIIYITGILLYGVKTIHNTPLEEAPFPLRWFLWCGKRSYHKVRDIEEKYALNNMSLTELMLLYAIFLVGNAWIWSGLSAMGVL